jgi:hypothetical protein
LLVSCGINGREDWQDAELVMSANEVDLSNSRRPELTTVPFFAKALHHGRHSVPTATQEKIQVKNLALRGGTATQPKARHNLISPKSIEARPQHSEFPART